MKTHGYGLLQAWPMLVETGDVIYGFEETGDVKLEGEFWVVDTGQQRCTVHQSIGIVTWMGKAKAKDSARKPDLAETVEREPEQAPVPTTPMHRCPHCKNQYTRKIDALVCERMCSSTAANVAGPACPKCGYQLADHDGVGQFGQESVFANATQSCLLTTGDVIPWDPRAVRITQAERDRVEREAIERSDKQDLTKMLGRLHELFGQHLDDRGDLVYTEMDRSFHRDMGSLLHQSEGLTGKAKLELREKLGSLIGEMRYSGALATPLGRPAKEWIAEFLAIYEGRE